jgi:hypothetical protein
MMRTNILEGLLPRTIFGCQENLSVHTQKQQLKMWNSKGKQFCTRIESQKSHHFCIIKK